MWQGRQGHAQAGKVGLQPRNCVAEQGRKPRGREPQPPDPTPGPKDQFNFTDPTSRIMPTKDGFQQAYNAQAAVAAGSLLVVANDVVQAANDKQQITPMLDRLGRLAEVLGRLSAVVESRKGGDVAASYTARLLSDPSLAAKKLGEEAIETVIAAVQADTDALASESADLLYHWLVVLAAAGVSLDEVAAKLEAPEGTSAHAEKAGRSG